MKKETKSGILYQNEDFSAVLIEENQENCI